MKEWTLNLGGDVVDIAGFSNSDWGGDCNYRKSISEYIFRMGDDAILLKMKKQTSVALSSVRGEYMAMCQAAKEVVWLPSLLEDFILDLLSPLVFPGDNQGAIALTQNLVFHPHLKHTAIQYHFTHGLVQAG